MNPDTPVFVQTDWSQLETWLTAHFSGDAVLQGELEGSLTGGYKVHALNAALIYDIDPADARTIWWCCRDGPILRTMPVNASGIYSTTAVSPA